MSHPVSAQIRQRKEVPEDLSGAMRVFSDLTHGLTNRLPLNSVEEMRAGRIANPCTLVRRFLSAGHRIGLPREWAERLHAWVGGQIDALWKPDARSLNTLRRLALRAESVGNEAELVCAIAQDADRAALEAERTALLNEMATDRLVLAALERRLEEVP